MDNGLKWIRSNMSLYHIEEKSKYLVTVFNSGNLPDDFKKYADNFFDAAEYVIHYLGEEAAEKYDIAKLDIWYFALIYLYRQSLELLLKANIFKVVSSNYDRKEIVGEIRHDLKQGFEKLIELKGLTTDGNENAQWLLAYLSDISCIDKESDMFRYPFGNKQKVLFDKQTHISLVATHDNMNKANSILNDIFYSGTFKVEEYEAFYPKLIVEGGHYYQQSVVGYKFAERSFYPFYSSYEKVGTFLKEIILKEHKSELFIPMCYIYRNAVELGLKRLIIEDSHIETEIAIKIMQKKKHSILGLWNSIVNEIKEYSNAPEDDTTIEDTFQYIQTFHNIDPSSDLFRYPCNKNMEIYFKSNIDFDIDNVSSCFQELCNFLDGVDGMLNEIKSIEAEMNSYYTDYMDNSDYPDYY